MSGNDPLRLIDDPSSPIGSDLVSAWSKSKAGGPSVEARQRALALGAFAVATTATATVGASAASAGTAATMTGATATAIKTTTTASSASIVALKALVGALVVAGTSVGAAVAVRHATADHADHAAAAPISVSATPTQTSVALPPPPPIVVTSTDEPTSAPTSSVDPAPLGAPATARPAAHTTTTASSSSVAREIEELDAARAALRHGDTAGALAMLDAFDVAHPKSTFGDEAMVVRVDAHLKAGDTKRAATLARSFVERRPRSPFAPRLRKVAENEGAR